MPFKTSLVWLVRKTIKAKIRKPDVWLTIQEVLMIIQYPLMLLAIQFAKSTIDVPMSPSPAPVMLPSLNFTAAATTGRPVVMPSPVCGGPGSKLLFAPDTASTRAAMEGVVARWYGLNSTCSLLGYPSASSLLRAYLAAPDSDGCSSTDVQVAACTLQQMVLAGVLFDDPSSNLGNYTIAMSRDTMTYDPTAKRSLSWPRLEESRVAFLGHNDADSVWLTSGFVALQYSLDRAIAALGSGDSAGVAAAEHVQLARFPLQAFKSAYEPGNVAPYLAIPLLCSVPAIVAAMLLGQFMLNEKCHNLVSGMRMMGMKFSTYYLSWFLIYVLIAAVGAAPMTIAVKAIGYLPNSDHFLLFVTLVLLGVASVPWTFLLLAYLGKGGTNDPEQAKQSAQAGSFFTTLLIGLYVLLYFTAAPEWAWTLSCLLCHVAGPAGVMRFVEMEEGGRGLGWAELAQGGRGPSLLGVWGFLVLDALLYLVLAVQRERKGLARTPMPKDVEPPRALPPEDVPAGLEEVVTLRNLGRAFAARPKPVVALSHLNLSLFEGQISCLLGQNGAGKTTTIAMLTGLFPPSEGDATIYGHNTRTEMDRIRAITGVCPQHDLTFSYLTCVENLSLIGAVKGLAGEALGGGEIDAWLEKVGLGADGKHNARTDTLSGGQRRKLSLACALIGSPKFVLLDEPTAGMDPASRRAVWSVMAEAKKGRAVVLTTHFLDEADALGDRIAILHKGRLQAVGSTAALKRQAAGAFRLTITQPGRGSTESRRGSNYAGTAAERSGGDNYADAATLLALARTSVPAASVVADDAEDVAIALPQEDAPKFAALFTALDEQLSGGRLSAAGGRASYGLAIPTLQEVFLKITAQADAAEIEQQESRERGKGGATSTTHDKPVAPAAPAAPADAPADAEAAGEYVPPPMSPNCQQQFWSALLQMSALFRDPLGAFCVFAFPLLLAILLFLLPPVLDSSPPPTAIDYADPATLQRVPISPRPWQEGTRPYVAPYTPPAGTLPSALRSAVEADGGVAEPIDGAAALTTALSEAMPSFGAAVGAYDLGVAASLYGVAVPSTVLYHNASHQSAVPVALQLLDAAYLQQAAPGVTLAPQASLLPYTGDNPPPLPTFIGAFITPSALSYLFIFLGMIALQGMVKDRLVDKTTHNQMVMGLGPMMRWVNQLLFWCFFWYLDLFVGVVILACFPNYVPGAAGMPAFALTILFAVPPVFCFLALTNFAFWCRTNVEDIVAQTYCNIIQLLVFYPTLLLSAIPVVRESPTARSVITYSLLLIPLNQLSFSLSAIYIVAQVAAYRKAYAPDDYEELSAADFFVWTVEIPNQDGASPGPLVCLVFSICTAPLWFYLLWVVDVKRYYYPGKVRPPVSAPPADEDPDVAAERARVEGGNAADATIRMVHLRKTFAQPKKKATEGKAAEGAGYAAVTAGTAEAAAAAAPAARKGAAPRKVAVDNLSLAIDGSGCFALLGPNGAGKTTTLSMLTGDISPTAGDAWVAGLSVRTELMQIFRLLGYCPQFGGLFPRGVSVKTHLYIYAHIKGLPKHLIERHCTHVIAEFGLQDHADKWVNKLSGGTKRKLVAAIALACEPKVCFLDEPTTGVDVGTRQFLWNKIRAKGKRGCALVLTTHYMEEADALANRVGIMVNGRLQVLGSPQHLKSTHGGGYIVELKGPAATAGAAKELVDRLFPHNKVLEAHGGFQVFDTGASMAGGRLSEASERRNEFIKLGAVFTALDGAKAELGLETYSLSQTTLEQVFLNISMRQVESS